MGIIEFIVVALLAIWIGGLALNVAGGLIHIILVLAVFIFLMRFFKKKHK